MECPLCGRPSGPGDRFCAACGAPLGGGSERPAAAGPPFVGRAFELDQLRRALERARTTGTPQLVTLLGPPGIGKTRLAAELAAGAGEVRFVSASCAEYGEEAPLAPIRDAFALAGIDSAAAAATLLAGEREAPRILDALGPLFGLAATDPQALRWGVRRLLERLARDEPLLLVLDNVHRGGELLLDVIDHVSELTHDVALVIVCLAEAELLERRPDWGTRMRHAFALQLEPLPPAHAEELLGALGGAPAAMRERILESAGGNPLFLEQLLALGRSTGGLSVAPTLEALLAARLELLPDRERSALENASILGLEFQDADVAAFDTRLGTDVLDRLVEKRLLHRTEKGLRFHHPLVREVAYREAPRELRADLHGRLADATQMPDVRAFHLERSLRERRELGKVDGAALELAYEAATLLREAGLRALGRGELMTGVDLLERATRLLSPADPRRLDLLPDLGHALVDVGEGKRGAAVLEEAVQRAAELGDRRAHAHARLAVLWTQRFVGGEGNWAQAAAEEAESLLPILEEAGDDRGLARAWGVLAVLLEVQGQLADARTLARKALEHARRAGDGRVEADCSRLLGDLLIWGPTPVEEATADLEAALADRPTLATESALLARLGVLLAMRGEQRAAREQLARAAALVVEVGIDPAPVQYWNGVAELVLDDAAAAERLLRMTRTLVESVDSTGWTTLPGLLGEALVRLGRCDDAARCAAECRAAAGDHDLQAQFLWRTVEAKTLALQGRFEQAVALVRAALALLDSSDAIGTIGDGELALAQVFRIAGEPADASAAATRAADAYALKGDRSSERRARELGAELAAEPLAQAT